MTNQFSNHTLYTISYSVIGEDHIDYYTDFSQASRDFDVYRRELNDQSHYEGKLENLVLHRVNVEIQKTLSFITEASLIDYINSSAFSGKISKSKLDFVYQQKVAY
ncbi:hypothetical protein [Xenorhabdus eapokensis]|uniref:hypothetical protein n=1 Tax=Xenorhabdus eapokensis TaxID=1873482 RepID=UPI0009393B5D|nr:hypothetical protein [Xenorhabdus eapokensis]